MARKRLNTNLLVALTAAIAVALLAAYLGARYYADSPDRAVGRAQTFEEKGDWANAAAQWGRAYRGTQNPEFGLRVVDAVSYQTSDNEVGRERLEQMGQQLRTILAANNRDPDVLRAVIRHFAGANGFLIERVTRPTTEVRDAARTLLEVIPGDHEAETYLTAVTLDLSEIGTENVSAEEAEAARVRLGELVATDPLDGVGVNALRQDLARRLRTRGVEVADVDPLLETFVQTVDAAAESAGEATSREGLPTDAAAALVSIGQAYDVAARVAEQTAQVRAAQAAQAGGTAPDAVTLRDAGRAAAEPLEAKAREQFERAVAALDDERDVLTGTFADAYVALAESQLRANDAAAAERTLVTLTERRPWDALASTRLAGLYERINRFADASAVLSRAVDASRQPLPQVRSHDGTDAVLRRAFIDLELAQALLRERRHARVTGGADAQAQRQQLTRARQAFDQYQQKARTMSLPMSPAVLSVEGQLAVAGGDIYNGMDQVERALRDYEQLGPQTRREQAELLRILADANREAGQVGGETDYLARAFALGGVVNDGLRLVELFRVSGDLPRARDTLERLQASEATLPEEVRTQIAGLAAVMDPDAGVAYERLPESTDAERAVKLRLAATTNRQAEAVRLAEALFETNPQDPNRGRALAQVYLQGDRRDDAIATLARFPDDEASARALEQLRAGPVLTAESIADPVQRKLFEAATAERDGDLARAIDLTREARQLAGAQADDAIGDSLFTLLVRADRLEEAEALSKSLGDGVNGRTYAVRLSIARGNVAKAADEANRLAEQFPRMALAQTLRSEVFRRVGRNTEAADSAVQGLRLAPTDLRVIVEAVVALEAAGRVDEAREAVATGLRIRPGLPQLVALDENLQLQHGDPGPVLARRRAELAEAAGGGDDVNARFRLAGTLVAALDNAIRRGDDDARRARADEAVDVVLGVGDALRNETRLLRPLAGAAIHAGDERRGRANDVFGRLVSADGAPLTSDAEAVTAAATFYANVDDSDAAERVVRRHIEAMPASVPRERRAGMILALSQLLAERQGRVRDAINVLDGFEDLPAVADRVITLLAAQASQGDSEALAQMRERVAADGMPQTALTAAALAELRVNEPDRAAVLLDRAARSDDNNPTTLFLRGVAEAQRRSPDLEKSATLLDRASRLAPGNLDALRNLARVRLQQGQRDAAENALQRLLEAQPGDVDARLTLAQLQLGKSPPDFASADRYFRGAEGTPAANSPVLLFARARMEADRGRAAEAVGFARRAVERSFEAREVVGRRMQAGGAGPSADEAQAANVPGFLNGYIDLLLQGGRTDEALREARAWGGRVTGGQGPTPWWLQAKEAEVLARAGRTREATAMYEAAYAAAGPEAGRQADAIVIDMGRRVGADAAYRLLRDRVERPDGGAADTGAAATASRIFADAGQTRRALELLETARQAVEASGQMTPDVQIAISQQAGSLHLASEPPELDAALVAFRRAQELAPDDVAANNNVAYALTLLAAAPGESDEAARRRLTDAVAFGRRAVDASRGVGAAVDSGVAAGVNPRIADTLGWAQANLAMRTGDSELLAESIRVLRGARADAEHDGDVFPEVYLHLATALEAAGDGEATLEAAQVGIEALRRREATGERVTPADVQTRRRLNEVVSRVNQSLPAADGAGDGAGDGASQ